MSDKQRQKILYLCTGNSCRSQMAEAFTRQLKGDLFQAFSAGVRPQPLDPRAAAVMAEAGLDISGQRSKDISELPQVAFDYVVTLCDGAREQCPFFPGPAKRLHRGFPDPPLLAASAASEQEALDIYRQVRDQIKDFVQALPQSLEQEQ